jgi:integrase
MRKAKIPGLYWDKETGQGSIDKRIVGVGRVRERFRANTWAEAEAQYHRAIGEAKRQASLPEYRTFRAAATKFLKEETKRSLDRDADCLANLDAWIGGLGLDRVHQGTLQPYIEHRRRQGVKSSTVARELAVVRRILVLASRVWRDENDKPWLPVAPLLRMPKWDDEAKPYPLSWDEQRRFFRLLPAHIAEMSLFAVNTGAREGIVCGLRWDWEVKVPELSTSVFIAPGTHTKNGTDCLIVLNSTARTLIDAQRGRHPETVFVYRGHPIHRMNNTGWRRAWRAAGLPTGEDVLSGPHNLRHTFARRLRIVGRGLFWRKGEREKISPKATNGAASGDFSGMTPYLAEMPKNDQGPPEYARYLA